MFCFVFTDIFVVLCYNILLFQEEEGEEEEDYDWDDEEGVFDLDSKVTYLLTHRVLYILCKRCFHCTDRN